jgi:MFS family permease
MKLPSTRTSACMAVSIVALAAMLSPLNTSMIVIALPELQREFGTSTSASTWLLTVFALASAVGHPLAGYLADRLGPRRVFVAGLVVTGASALAAAYAASFSLLTALRSIQALGTSAAFPAGTVLLRMLDTQNCSGRPLPAPWLGAIVMFSNLGAALGPMLGGALMVAIGWRAIFLANRAVLRARRHRDGRDDDPDGDRVGARNADRDPDRFTIGRRRDVDFGCRWFAVSEWVSLQ